MSCGLVRLRCERRFGVPETTARSWPDPDHRLFDVPPELVEPISSWYEDRGWEVLAEPI